jgi:regulator of ribonuclease activity A
LDETSRTQSKPSLRIMNYRTADLVDAFGDSLQVCEASLYSYGRRSCFHGQIRTVKCHEDNVLLRKVLSEPGHGQILVVDGGGSLRTALMGDMIARVACDNRWVGIVIWGAVRDVRMLTTLDIGIKAAGLNPRKSGKTGAGQVDIPVEFGGVVFHAGAWLYSDEDGIVVGADHFDPAKHA